MSTYYHRKLAKRIAELDKRPDDHSLYPQWVEALELFKLMEDNIVSNELIIYASGRNVFVNSVLVKESELESLTAKDLVHWNERVAISRAGYSWLSTDEEVSLEEGRKIRDWPINQVTPLVFRRGLSEAKNDSKDYCEILQEYPHAVDAHYQSDRRAFSNFDSNGDWRDIISITIGRDGEDATLVSFLREEMEEYLAVSDSALVLMYEFLLVTTPGRQDWPPSPGEVTVLGSNHAYRQLTIPDKARRTHGVQIIRPIRSRREIFDSIRGIGTRNMNPQYAQFTIHDWRNDKLARVSTDPKESTNYFEASNNSLPYEVSPAFFRPEVLQKYKMDKDKYSISEESRSISCRGAWGIESYDVNEAGQVHVYLVYLRGLPYSEQLYWQAHNEEPKTGISQRAYENDVKVEFSDKGSSLISIIDIARRWSNSDLEWWKLPDRKLLERVTSPVTDSRDEWSQSFLELAKLLVEGFQLKPLRIILRKLDIHYDNNMRSLALLELILSDRLEESKLTGLREIWRIRNITIAHSVSEQADFLSQEAMKNHGTYREHFESVCTTVIRELNAIEACLCDLPA